MSKERKIEQNGSLFESARSWVERLRDMATGMTREQLASTARIVAVILAVIALYNGYKVLTYLF